MIGNNSCGTHSLLAGKTVDNIEELRILLHDGTVMTVSATTDKAEIDSIVAQKEDAAAGLIPRCAAFATGTANLIRARFQKIPRRVSGYNLDQLLPENGFHVARSLVGTEANLRDKSRSQGQADREPSEHNALIGLGYADIFSAADHVPEILNFQPIGLEGFEGTIVDGLRKKKELLISIFFPKGVASCSLNSDRTIPARPTSALISSSACSSKWPIPPISGSTTRATRD